MKKRGYPHFQPGIYFIVDPGTCVCCTDALGTPEFAVKVPAGSVLLRGDGTHDRRLAHGGWFCSFLHPSLGRVWCPHYAVRSL